MKDQDSAVLLGHTCEECTTEDASVYVTDNPGGSQVLNHCVLCGSEFPGDAESQNSSKKDVSRLRCEDNGFTFYVPQWMTERRDAGELLRYCPNCGGQSLDGGGPDIRRRDDAMVNTEHGRERRNTRSHD